MEKVWQEDMVDNGWYAFEYAKKAEDSWLATQIQQHPRIKNLQIRVIAHSSLGFSRIQDNMQEVLRFH